MIHFTSHKCLKVMERTSKNIKIYIIRITNTF